MRNISTDALHPWDRSMWTDSLTPLHEQFGMTAIEARLDRWYFDGDGDNGENGDTPEGEQTQAEEAAQQAAAEAAAEAAGFGGMGPDDLSTDAPGLTAEEAEAAFDAVGDLSDYSTTDAAQAATDIAAASVSGSTADLSGFDTSAVDEAIDQLNEIGEVSVGYNDLAGFTDEKGFGLSFGPEESYFDRKEDDIQRADRAIAEAIQKNAKAQGRDVEVSVDPQGQFSYTPGPTGSLADVAAVAGSQMAQGFADLAPMASPAGFVSSMVSPDLFDLGLDLAPRDLAATATQGVLSDRQGTFDRGEGAGPATMSFDEAVAQGIASVGPTDIQAPSLEDFTIFDSPDPTSAFAQRQAEENLSSLTPGELEEVVENLGLTRDERSLRDEPLGEMAITEEAVIENLNRDAMERQDRAAQQLSVDQGVVSPGGVITDPNEEQMVADAAQAAAEGAVGPGSDIQFAQFDDSLLAEDVDLLGDLLGDEDQGGDNVVVEAKPKPDPETEPPVEDTPPRPFEILPFAASTPFTPRTQYGQIVPFTRTQFARPGGIANLQRQLAILNRRLFT
jgi:hypothetical protein